MGGKEKIRICKQYSTKKIEDWESLNEKIKRKAHVKQSFSLDFLERGTFTEYPYVFHFSSDGMNDECIFDLADNRRFF